MTLREKLNKARKIKGISQIELSEMTGMSKRSLQNYEQFGTIPRISNLQKLADVLNVSVLYLIDDSKTDAERDADEELFIATAIEKYGYKGAKEACDIIDQTSKVLGEKNMDAETKHVFYQALMDAYLESKAEAKEKFTPKKYRKNLTDER